MLPKLIIFDFDGTLADTTADTISVYQQTIKALGADPRSDDECQATIGIPLKEGFRQLYPDYSESELDNCVDTYRRIYNADIVEPRFSDQSGADIVGRHDLRHLDRNRSRGYSCNGDTVFQRTDKFLPYFLHVNTDTFHHRIEDSFQLKSWKNDASQTPPFGGRNFQQNQWRNSITGSRHLSYYDLANNIFTYKGAYRSHLKRCPQAYRNRHLRRS